MMDHFKKYGLFWDQYKKVKNVDAIESIPGVLKIKSQDLHPGFSNSAVMIYAAFVSLGFCTSSTLFSWVSQTRPDGSVFVCHLGTHFTTVLADVSWG